MQRQVCSVCRLVAGIWVCAALALAQPFEVVVAPSGNDAWSGRRAEAGDGDGPLRSLRRAQEVVRERRRQAPDQAVTVWLRGGLYELAEPWLFTPDASGSESAPVRYAAYGDETPVISGGVRLTAWRQEAAGHWVADLPAELHGTAIRKFYVNGLRRTLARTPNEGEYFRIAEPPLAVVDPATGEERNPIQEAFRFKAGDLRAWPRLGEIDAVVMRNWESAILPVASLDEATRMVVFRGPMKWDLRANLRYYVQGFREALDAPGEWWVDRGQGQLHYLPLPGENLAEIQAVVPRLAQLAILKGDPAAGRYVEHIQFAGLTFAHTDNRVPATGHSDWQAAVTIEAAIQADGARHIAIRDGEVRNSGWYGIWFRRGCTGNRVERCELRDLGAGGVRFGESGRQSGVNATGHNTVHNCLIHDGSVDYYGAIPVWIGQASDNRVTHNEICDFNYTGISVGWSWGFAETTCHRNEIAWNHLHHLGRGVLYDMAAIYTLGISTGTAIHHNLIHHVWGFVEGYGAGGIYPDEGSSGLLIENNITYLTQSGGLTIHFGRDILVRNNIFAFGQRSQIHLGRADKQSSQTLENNIVHYSEGALYERLSELRTARNIYWHTENPALVEFPGGADFADWQKQGHDAGSLVADPLFVDASAYDFRLRPESPALALGFQPIDLSAAGLVGAEWRQRAAAIQRPRIDKLPEKERTPPVPLRADFEGEALGKPPAFGTVYGATEATGIRVSDRQAAGGARSLHFQDGPDLKESYNPHLYYRADLAGKELSGSFDLFLEPGAVFVHEWRYGNTPFVGGVNFAATAGGEALLNKQPICAVPAGTWIHVELTADLSQPAAKVCRATVTVPGQPPRTVEAPVPQRFRAMDWVVFVSDATTATGFHLDNIVLETKAE